ncbi:splicing regulatory glutamine/lysine-rich protein 1-like [Anastrepha ludens]|uniref:splicing regulatory glutamine/lysine-rich protein 1-like n=1 Tax=Anastrepha ludens TaxID=28586 RepID=UPI0023AF8EEA|nr:splicing regulatory glutamine/lysine-rich protein 1-like [Anastrepha ludens]
MTDEATQEAPRLGYAQQNIHPTNNKHYYEKQHHQRRPMYQQKYNYNQPPSQLPKPEARTQRLETQHSVHQPIPTTKTHAEQQLNNHEEDKDHKSDKDADKDKDKNAKDKPKHSAKYNKDKEKDKDKEKEKVKEKEKEKNKDKEKTKETSKDYEKSSGDKGAKELTLIRLINQECSSCVTSVSCSEFRA